MWYYYTWHVVSQRKEVFFFFLQVCSLRQRTDGFNFTDFTDVPTTSPVTDFEPRSGWKPSFNADQLEPCSFYTIVTASFCLALAVGSKTRRLGKKKKKERKVVSSYACLCSSLRFWPSLNVYGLIYCASFLCPKSKCINPAERSYICGLCFEFKQCSLCLYNSVNT